MTRITIICISCIMVTLMFAGQSYAEVDTETIVGIWLFDEGGGDVAQDSSGNGNDGTLHGPEWTNESKFGGALEFNGAGSYIEFATGESMKTPHFTIMAWFSTRKLDGYGHIFQTGNDWNDMAGYVFRVHQDGTVQGGLAFGPGNITTFVTGPAIEADTWYHLALTYDGTTATLYLDSENVSSNPGQGEIMYDDQPVRIGVHSNDTASPFDGFIDEVGLFDVALAVENIEAIMNNGLAGAAGAQPFASRPSPKDGALHVDTWITLSWQPGDFAASHDVYLGDHFDDVNDATRDSDLYRGNQALTFYVAGFPGFAYPDGLVPGTTYYWRIDEVNAPPDETIFMGDVWSFSIPPKTAYNPNPADGAESIDLGVTLSWTAGFGAKMHTVYFGDDFDTVANATVGMPRGTTTYKPGPLKAAKLYYWRIDEFDGIATYKGDVWSFTTLGAVGNPDPADGAADVSQTPTLTWTPGVPAASHEIYFGDNEEVVRNATKASPEFKATKALGDESYEPGKLAWNTTYYWRIDEANNTNPDSPWTGKVWSFTTANFMIVEDFESYTDDDAAGQAIWQHWIDGFGVADNGAQVGYLLPPYAEQNIVYGGDQSMPLLYTNEAGVTNSEAVLTLSAARDWTEEGVAELSLWFHGLPGSVGSFMEAPAGTYTLTASGTDIWDVGIAGDYRDEFHFAYKTLTGAGSITARVMSVQNTDGWAKAGVMIRETLDGGSKHAFACITPSNGVAAQGRTTTGAASFNANQTGITAPHWVKLERSASGNFTVSHSANGTTWQAVTGATPQNISMGSNVYIGLALTAHNAAATCEAVFSNVTTTGTVSGQWMNQDIGIASNAAEPLYVAVSNSSGSPAVVAHDDPAAATIDAWTEWRVPLQALADQGINLSNVDKIAVGLGSKSDLAAPGGSGMMYIDDIRLYRPEPQP